jgi:DUF1009 family protein
METLGLIAGTGRFPVLVAKAYRKSTGNMIHAVSFCGEENPELSNCVDECTVVSVGELGRLIDVLKASDVKRAIMAGRIAHTRLFDDIESLAFDVRGRKLFFSLRDKRADTILRAVAQELRSEGIELMDSTAFVNDRLAKKGVLTKRRPNEIELRDIEFGRSIALEMGRLDVGQTVVVKNQSVVAVEAMEGTDETIIRGGKLAKNNAVVIKMAKPGQDMRFDVPIIGTQTIETMREAGAAVLAISEGNALILDLEDVVRKADEYGVCIAVV